MYSRYQRKKKEAKARSKLEASRSTPVSKKEDSVGEEKEEEESFELIRMAGELPKETEDALLKIISDDLGAITGDVLSVFEECLKAFEYKGFDPDKIRKILAIRQSKLRQGTVIDIKDSVSINVFGPKGLSNLVSLLMILFNLRGNNLEAIMDGLEPKTKASVEAIFTVLDLKSKVVTQGKPKSSETLTLSRISAAFPLHSLTVARNPKFVRQIIDLSDIGVTDSELGRCMQHPVCASTMTKRMIQDGCHMVTFLAAIRLNAIIGQAQKTTTERLWLFHLAVLGSKAVPEVRKNAYWTHLYEPEAVKSWISQAQRILEKDIPAALFDTIKSYKPT